MPQMKNNKMWSKEHAVEKTQFVGINYENMLRDVMIHFTTQNILYGLYNTIYINLKFQQLRKG